MSNIYDCDAFFKGYREIRENPYSANDLVESPVLFSMLPDVAGRRVLDLGSGYGDSCRRFIKMGASEVIGIDNSKNMLAEAVSRGVCSGLSFVEMSLEDFSSAKEKLGTFDLIVSSLAMHYVKQYEALLLQLYAMLSKGGILLFSQEHPIFTASKSNALWLEEGDGRVKGLVVSDYPYSGLRRVKWIVDGFEKYHRSLSDVINPIIAAGFVLEEIQEPKVSPQIVEENPSLSRCLQVPDYLFVKARKP